jgi:hypothetical protein
MGSKTRLALMVGVLLDCVKKATIQGLYVKKTASGCQALPVK